MLNIQLVFPMSFGCANRYLNCLFETLCFITPEKTLMGEKMILKFFFSVLYYYYKYLPNLILFVFNPDANNARCNYESLQLPC